MDVVELRSMLSGSIIQWLACREREQKREILRLSEEEERTIDE